MKNLRNFVISFILLVECIPMPHALTPFGSLKDMLSGLYSNPENFRQQNRVKRLPSENGPDVLASSQEMNLAKGPLRKREIKNEFAKKYCFMLGSTCGKLPALKVLCLLRCYFGDNEELRPYLNLIPQATMQTCQSTNTAFNELPGWIYKNRDTFANIQQILSAFGVVPGEEADFAKSAADALLVTMILKSTGLDFDEFKPFIRRLEFHDSDKEGPPIPIEINTLTQLLTIVNAGNFVNKNCKESGLEDESVLLADLLQKRRCMLDFLMPGYFVFSRAPDVAPTRRIEAMLRAWNLPLYSLTGTGCCLSRFAEENKYFECFHNISQGWGPPYDAGPGPEVCGAIPSFKPGTIKPNVTDNGGGVKPGPVKPCEHSPDYKLVEGLDEENSGNCTLATPSPGTLDYSGEVVANVSSDAGGSDYGNEYGE